MKQVLELGIVRKPLYLSFTLAALLLISGCVVRFIPPYDEKLVADTEAIYKKASAMIDIGMSKSPLDDTERLAIVKPETNEAYYSKFEAIYNELSTDSEALILRGIANSGGIVKFSLDFQDFINNLIDSAIPSNCPESDAIFGNQQSNLTVKSFIDLKCIFIKWKSDHANKILTQGTLILKRSNWEGRKKGLFDAILAIQQAEAFKK